MPEKKAEAADIKDTVLSRAECFEILGLPERASENDVRQRYGCRFCANISAE